MGGLSAAAHLSLPAQAVSQRQAIEDFLAAGNSLLNLQASSSEEIGRAGQEARHLVAQLADVSQVGAQKLVQVARIGHMASTSKLRPQAALWFGVCCSFHWQQRQQMHTLLCLIFACSCANALKRRTASCGTLQPAAALAAFLAAAAAASVQSTCQACRSAGIALWDSCRCMTHTLRRSGRSCSSSWQRGSMISAAPLQALGLGKGWGPEPKFGM